MAKFLLSFPSAAMVVPDGELQVVGRDTHAVIEEAKVVGVYLFADGIEEDIPPILASANGTVTLGPNWGEGFPLQSAEPVIYG